MTEEENKKTCPFLAKGKGQVAITWGNLRRIACWRLAACNQVMLAVVVGWVRV